MFEYTLETWFILLGMVTTGAARSVAVKILYQTGFEAPIYVTLLYLVGQSLSLFVYAYQSYCTSSVEEEDEEDMKTLGTDTTRRTYPNEQSYDTIASTTYTDQSSSSKPTKKKRIGEPNGLQEAQEEQNAERVRQVPFLLKPVIPGLCNMFNSLLRWASLIYIAASIGEMLISGLELALSVLAARLIRQRLVSKRRWLGVGVVIVGLTLIGLADVLFTSSSESHDEDDATGHSHMSRRDSFIGIVLIVGQCLLSVLQDIAEEVFMQAGDFPPTLLLGMEGLFGFLFALLLFFLLGDAFGQGPSQTLQDLQQDKSFLIGYSVGLTLLFTVTGVFNIKATQVTSAMTRNVWKNLRTVLVWIVALLIFYLGGNESLGEAFVIPGSLVIVAGFAIMLVGIFVYYSQKAKEDQNEATEQGNRSVDDTGDFLELDMLYTNGAIVLCTSEGPVLTEWEV